MIDELKINVNGHVMIKCCDTGQILLNKKNAIHSENMSVAIASVMANTVNNQGEKGFFHHLALGNGGTVLDSSGNITYREPKVQNINDELYSQIHLPKRISYSEDDNAANNSSIIHTGQSTFSDVIVKCTLDYNERLSDGLDMTDNGNYVFNELGLLSQQGKLLTHLIFHPVAKNANRKMQILYTLRISIG